MIIASLINFKSDLPRPAFNEPVIWYQALAAVQADKIALGEELLKELIAVESKDYAALAEALLDDLRQR